MLSDVLGRGKLFLIRLIKAAFVCHDYQLEILILVQTSWVLHSVYSIILIAKVKMPTNKARLTYNKQINWSYIINHNTGCPTKHVPLDFV